MVLNYLLAVRMPFGLWHLHAAHADAISQPTDERTASILKEMQHERDVDGDVILAVAPTLLAIRQAVAELAAVTSEGDTATSRMKPAGRRRELCWTSCRRSVKALSH